jgi:acetyl-CoA carboxylase alpha subunit
MKMRNSNLTLYRYLLIQDLKRKNADKEKQSLNIFEMVHLKVPIITIIVGEGASGGALGIGVGDRCLYA